MQHLSLFNHPNYSGLNVEGEQRYWRHDVLRAGRVGGALAGVVNGPHFLSGFSAPFGDFEIMRNRENPALIHDVVAEATAALATTAAVLLVRFKIGLGYTLLVCTIAGMAWRGAF